MSLQEPKKGFNLSRRALEHAALTRYWMLVLMVLGAAVRAMVVRTYWPGATVQQVAKLAEELYRRRAQAPNACARCGQCGKELVPQLKALEAEWDAAGLQGYCIGVGGPPLVCIGATVLFCSVIGRGALIGMIQRSSDISIDQIDRDRANGIPAWDAFVGSAVRRSRPIVRTAAVRMHPNLSDLMAAAANWSRAQVKIEG